MKNNNKVEIFAGTQAPDYRLGLLWLDTSAPAAKLKKLNKDGSVEILNPTIPPIPEEVELSTSLTETVTGKAADATVIKILNDKIELGGSGGLSGTSYVYVAGAGTPTENATELQAAYNKAKTMPRYLGVATTEPNKNYYKGQTFKHPYVGTYHRFIVDALNTVSIDDSSKYESVPTESEATSVRATVIVAPGEYNFEASAFVVDTPGINIVSLTGNSDVIISSTEKDNEYYPAYGIKVVTSNILIKGIDCKTNVFYIESSLNNLICEYCIGGEHSFGKVGGGGTISGTFNYCKGGNNSFGTLNTIIGTFNYCTGGDYSFGAFSGDASGTFNNCIGGEGSFGGGGTNASGIFTNCKAGDYSFGTITAIGTFNNCEGGDSSFGDFAASGIFKDCIGGNNSFSRNASGTFTNCTGGDESFGTYGGDASGTFNDCTGGNKSFGRVSSGTFNHCTGGNYSFGSGSGDGYTGTVSGTFNNCIGGSNSFGTYDGTIVTSARLYYTRLTSGTFPTPVAGGRLILCIDGDNNIVTI